VPWGINKRRSVQETPLRTTRFIRSLPEREGYAVDETAHVLGIGRTKTYDLIRQGGIRAIKIGSRTIIPRSEVERLLNGGQPRSTNDESDQPNTRTA